MKKIILVLFLISFLALPLLVTNGANGIGDEAPEVDPMEAFGRILGAAFYILLGLAGFCLIIAGFMFVTAGGNTETVGKARAWVLYAIIGVVLAILARGIVVLIREIVEA